MNDIHTHLIINHFPIIGAIFAMIVLVTGIFIRSELIKRMAYGLFIVTALLVLPTNNSGEKAEHSLEKAVEVSEKMIEEHEELAEIGFWSLLILGFLSIIGFYLSIKENGISGVFAIVILVSATVSIIYLWKTGESGGKIRHTETYLPTT